MRVGFYQFRPRFGQPQHNCAKVVERLRRVRADLIVVPELAYTGYYFKDRAELRALAEPPRESPIVQSLTALCKRQGFHLVTGFAEQARDKVFNSALLLGPRGIKRVYRKLHLFNLEKKWFDPGDTEPAIDRIRNVRVGMMICFDWVFPEIARALALQGADVICNPSNLVLGHAQDAMRTRSIENGVFSILTNRYGSDNRPHGSVRFTGRSQITGCRGEVLFRAPSQRETLHVVKIDPTLARDKMITPGNHLLKDRRPEFYP